MSTEVLPTLEYGIVRQPHTLLSSPHLCLDIWEVTVVALLLFLLKQKLVRAKSVD